MQVWGLDADQCAAIVARVSADKYAGNIRTENVRRDGRSARFTLRAYSSHGEGARRSAPSPWKPNGRATIAASWTVHYDVMLALLDAGATRIKSAMADYRGAPYPAALVSNGYDLDDVRVLRKVGTWPTARDAFLAIAERTYDVNAGSIVYPSAFGDL